MTRQTPLNATDKQQEKVATGWQAHLSLGFSNRGDKTVVRDKLQRGPLAIQRPLYPEGDVCHVYLLHPPGGVVGGDELLIEAKTHPGAHALVTTPGATKFYRSEGKIAKQKQRLIVSEESCLEWLPQENIFFPSGQVQVDTEIHLEKNALFMGWEMHCFGRPALKECFTSGKVWGKTQLFVEGKKLLTESLLMNGLDKSILNSGLQGNPMMGTFFITAQTNQDLKLVQNLLSDIEQKALSGQTVSGQFGEKAELTLGATQLDGIIVVRAFSRYTEVMLDAFSEVWRYFRYQWFGYQADTPRIWAT